MKSFGVMDSQIQAIQSHIVELRGVKVIVDRDLAAMYGVETRALNQAVKRNIERFPEDFMFRMTDEELAEWKSQIVMSNAVKMGVRRPPYVFTELGVAMLSSVLSSPVAIQVNIGIMRAFVAMRQMVTAPVQGYDELKREIGSLKEYVEEILCDQNDINESVGMQIELINEAIARLEVSRKAGQPRRRIGFISDDD